MSSPNDNNHPQWRRCGLIRLPNDTTWPLPHDEKTAEAMHAARYSLASLTKDQAYRILALAEAYQHLAAHPAGTEAMIADLRLLRRSLKEAEDAGR